MSDQEPYAHVGGPPLRREPPPPKRQHLGYFQANLGGTLWTTSMDELPPGLCVALLTHPPKPEGIGFKELVADGYARRPVEFERGAGAFARGNREPVAFGPVKDWDPVTHVAIFDAAGMLLYYGALKPYAAGRPISDEINFDLHTLHLRVAAKASA